MKTLVLVEHEGGQVKDATLAAVTAAAKLGEVHLLVAGAGRRRRRRGGGEDRRRRQGPCRRRRGLRPQLAENVAPLAAQLMAGSRRLPRARRRPPARTSPRASPPCSTSCRSRDILSVEGEDTFTRPIYAGNAIATVKSSDAKKVITVRGTAFEKAAREGGSAARSRPVSGDGRHGPLLLRRRRALQVRAARADQRQDHRLGRPRVRLVGAVPRPARSARRQAEGRGRRAAAPRSTRAMRPTTIRSARPARSSPRKSISRSAFRARSSTSPG